MSFWRRREVQGFVLLLPYMLLFALFVILPLVQTFIASFSGSGDLLANYRALFESKRYVQAMMHTTGYTLFSAVLVMLLAFPAAFLVHKVVNRHKRIRYLLAMPYASSMMALSLIWLMLFNPTNGLANKLMPLFGASAQNWLEEPLPAFLCVFSLVFWRCFSFTLLSCLQAMESQPQEIYEFAALSGAGSWQTFRHITMPQMLPSMMYVLPTAVISVLTTFEPIFLLTYAGMDPDMTNTMAYEFYRLAKLGQPGMASALAVLMLIPILLCCYGYMRRTFARKAAK